MVDRADRKDADAPSLSFTPSPSEARKLRDAFGRFATGVTVVATHTPEGPMGMTANSFSSVSLDPPLVLWCIDRGSDRFHIFDDAKRYAIHVLGADQEELSTGFAKTHDYFAHIDWHEGADRVPVIPGCLARFDCELEARHDAGDHVILVGRILSFQMREGTPLLFLCGDYGDATPRLSQ